MDYKVEMLAFGEADEIRVVNVEEHPNPENLIQCLEDIFINGQNEFQRLDHPSVSTGDVIQYHDHRYLVLSMGFHKLSNENYEKYKNSDHNARRLLLYNHSENI